MDTGALTASLSVTSKPSPATVTTGCLPSRRQDASDKVYEHKVSRISKIKSRADEDEDKDEATVAKRPVIDLKCAWVTSSAPSVQPHRPQQLQLPLLISAKAFA